MQIKRETDVTICDSCKKETYGYKCLGCGAEYCSDCRKTQGRQYNHSVHFSGSYDGFFCWKCLSDPPQHIIKILPLYERIRALRNEYKAFWDDFDKRTKEAEEELKGQIEHDTR